MRGAVHHPLESIRRSEERRRPRPTGHLLPVSASWLTVYLLTRSLDGPGSVVRVGLTGCRLQDHHGTVVDAIPGAADRRLGRVLVDREDWRAESCDGAPIPVGTRIRVAGIRGNRLVVTALDGHRLGRGPRLDPHGAHENRTAAVADALRRRRPARRWPTPRFQARRDPDPERS